MRVATLFIKKLKKMSISYVTVLQPLNLLNKKKWKIYQTHVRRSQRLT